MESGPSRARPSLVLRSVQPTDVRDLRLRFDRAWRREHSTHERAKKSSSRDHRFTPFARSSGDGETAGASVHVALRCIASPRRPARDSATLPRWLRRVKQRDRKPRESDARYPCSSRRCEVPERMASSFARLESSPLSSRSVARVASHLLPLDARSGFDDDSLDVEPILHAPREDLEYDERCRRYEAQVRAISASRASSTAFSSKLSAPSETSSGIRLEARSSGTRCFSANARG